MKLREMFEGEQPANSVKTIGISFGRFNPPHKGHAGVWRAASKNPIWYVGTNDSTSGPKDPLPYDVKLQCMAAVFPAVAGHVVPEQGLLTLATSVYNKYGENVHLKVYTDESWLADVLVKYNGAESEHGMYKFKHIEHVATERLASATDLRSAVRSGNRKEFYRDMGVGPSVTIEVDGEDKPIFDVVAHYLNQYPEKVKKAVKAKEDAAGVGIITKQNTTVDVNKNTPKKNLRAFRLAEQIKEMTAMLESSQAKMTKRQQQSTRGVNTYGDSEHMSGDYTAYRLGMAVAGANGKDPIEMKAKSWIGKKKTTHPYTQEEQDMLKQAYQIVGADYQDTNKGDMKSRELDSTHKVSPIATPKRNKYGV
jgi:nicotinamide mononucleotide adenylyltransferase